MKLMTSMAALLALAAPALAQDAPEPTREERQAQSRVTEIAGPEPRLSRPPRASRRRTRSCCSTGRKLDGWESVNGGAAEWVVEDGAMRVARGSGDIRTTESFCDVQLHVEWRSPPNNEGHDSQDRGNSGIFLQSRYEVQVLDSFENPTYAKRAGGVDLQAAPAAGERLARTGRMADLRHHLPGADLFGRRRAAPSGHIPVLHNGVVVQTTPRSRV